MKRSVGAADFLQNMSRGETNATPITTEAKEPIKARRPANKRDGLKHIGGYLTADLVEKVAILRARLDLDNSELITLAINDLHAKHMAKRAFGDS